MIDYYIWSVCKNLKVWKSPRQPDFRDYYNAFPCYHGSHVFAYYQHDWYEGFVVSPGVERMLVDVGRKTIQVLTSNVKHAELVLLTANLLRKIDELQGIWHEAEHELRADLDMIARELSTDALLRKEKYITVGMLRQELFGKTSQNEYREFYDKICRLRVGIGMGTARQERENFKRSLKKTQCRPGEIQ